MIWMINKIYSRSGENVYGKVLELENIWIYVRGINELRHEWQRVIQNNCEYIIDWN